VLQGVAECCKVLQGVAARGPLSCVLSFRVYYLLACSYGAFDMDTMPLDRVRSTGLR